MKPFTDSITYKNVKYECIQLITTNGVIALYYSLDVLNKRWAEVGRPDVEVVIGKNQTTAYAYVDILKRSNQDWNSIGNKEAADMAQKYSKMINTFTYKRA
jgi:hypothetical protein